jgi:DNA-binding CsgD family transcriptional regulator
VKKADRSKQADGIPVSDPAYSIIAGIVDLVPASQWSFARIRSNGDLYSLAGSQPSGAEIGALAEEFRRQRAASPVGPRIAATLHPSDAASGITMIFADARVDYGIMTLLRDATLGPFMSSEVSMLTFALDAGSDRLSALRLQPPMEHDGVEPAARATVAPAHPEEAFYVLDHDMQIVLAWSAEQQRRIAVTGIQEQIAERLPAVLEETVRELTAAWKTGASREPGFARPVSFLVVRTQPMSGPAGLFTGVRIDRFQPPNSLTGAAARFHISPREVQVLALLLDGDQLEQIAEKLHITSSTVQDHIKSMLDKTESRNRSELIARILGWESPAHLQSPVG